MSKKKTDPSTLLAWNLEIIRKFRETPSESIPGTGSPGEDGKSLEYKWVGTKLGIRVEGEETYRFVDLKGQDGKSPYIDKTTGQWFIGDVDTGISAKGTKGDKGEQGVQGPMGPKGDPGETGAQGPKGDKGDDGDDYLLNILNTMGEVTSSTDETKIPGVLAIKEMLEGITDDTDSLNEKLDTKLTAYIGNENIGSYSSLAEMASKGRASIILLRGSKNLPEFNKANISVGGWIIGVMLVQADGAYVLFFSTVVNGDAYVCCGNKDNDEFLFANKISYVTSL